MSRYENPGGDAPQKTEAEAIAEIVRRSTVDVAVINVEGGVPVVAHPLGGNRTLESLERFEPRPRRKRAIVNLRDHMSFIDYVQRHKEPGTLLLCDIGEKGGSFTALLDYHRSNTGDGELGIGEPRWGDHVCRYTAEFTPEWKRWNELSGKPQDQVSIAQFIEDNLFDIANPEPAAMLELVKTLEATSGVQFKSAIRLENGDRALNYAHTTQAKAGQQGQMEIPQKFRLKFAVFTNGPTQDIDCRFRYRIDEGNLLMWWEVERPHKIIELALTEARNAIQQTLNMPVLLGSGGVSKA